MQKNRSIVSNQFTMISSSFNDSMVIGLRSKSISSVERCSRSAFELSTRRENETSTDGMDMHAYRPGIFDQIRSCNIMSRYNKSISGRHFHWLKGSKTPRFGFRGRNSYIDSMYSPIPCSSAPDVCRLSSDWKSEIVGWGRTHWNRLPHRSCYFPIANSR